MRSGSVKFGFYTSKSSPGTPPDCVLAAFQNGRFAFCVLGTLRLELDGIKWIPEENASSFNLCGYLKKILVFCNQDPDTPYSINSLFSEFFRKFSGSFSGFATLFGDYLGVIWEVFCEVFEGETIIQRVNAKTRKTVFVTI